ncbi:NADPH-dependent FMN reductase [Sphingomonas sp. AR_OL41]|jgi:FMN reductase|uniref:NADPH-dependent FMN reductase n=1 Tax=Sphingomonas sp. AR_OL41 TaxID=3042729 RepID=UPI0024808BD7|nr:NADPH-dependent FMN reductase [Sphingomonas sp. AR_OL41]MDH7972157.1 NADPH-dependent FMN reductase [Sphingomonas sp. AR_OL41]
MADSDDSQPLVVGIGGTIGGISSTERALRIALDAAGREGFRTRLFGGEDMARLPLYDPKAVSRTAHEQDFVDTVRGASALIIASPGYHGSISGVVKNALDLLEETARDPARPYLADMPVGLIATAYGWQATGSTIAALRSIVHALRGWPTPFAAAINSAATKFDDVGGASDPAVVEQLCMVGRQVARFAPLAESMARSPQEADG